MSDTIAIKWKRKALENFAYTAVEKITTKDIQIKLNVGYHLALQIKEWLVKIK